MKKTRGVTKYEIEWQILRVTLKGSLNESEYDLLIKINQAFDYFERNKIYERWERVFNWLEGLLRGYHSKEPSLRAIIQDKIDEFECLKPEIVLSEETINSEKILEYGDDLLKLLWVDLFRTNKKWLLKGYFHKECNDFMDLVYEHLRGNSLDNRQKELLVLRKNSFLIENNHKFFF